MTDTHGKYVVGTSGYSFRDWVGTFYPAGTSGKEMFAHYASHFQTVELNFTFYNRQPGRTLERMAARAPDGFDFWVKANQELTHKGNLAAAEGFCEQVEPMRASGKMAGLLLQFPQSFHRTAEARKYLAELTDSLGETPLAVEFRHCSWDNPATVAGLADRGVTLVVPDVPAIDGLYRAGPVATTPVGYLRLHSRNADLWYAGAAERYDYSYTDQQLADIVKAWGDVEASAQRIYAFFNNCHRGQAAQNAEAFRRILAQIPQ